MEFWLLKKKKLACAVNASLSSRLSFQNEELRLVSCLEGSSSLPLAGSRQCHLLPFAELLGPVSTQASRMGKAEKGLLTAEVVGGAGEQGGLWRESAVSLPFFSPLPQDDAERAGPWLWPWRHTGLGTQRYRDCTWSLT